MKKQSQLKVGDRKVPGKRLSHGEEAEKVYRGPAAAGHGRRTQLASDSCPGNSCQGYRRWSVADLKVLTGIDV